MNAKIKYNVSGLGEVEVEVDSSAIQGKKGRDEYRDLHRFLTGILSGTTEKNSQKQDVPSNGESRAHNKSQPHFKADRRLAKTIIDNGGLRFLHGVNIINKKQVFFFDKTPAVQDIVERYNMQEDMEPAKTKQAPPAKRSKEKAGKKCGKNSSAARPTEKDSEAPAKDSSMGQPAAPNEEEISAQPGEAMADSAAASGSDAA